MNTKSMVAGMTIGSLLVLAGLPATQVVRAESDTAMSKAAIGMVGGHEVRHATMASMMWMMHQGQGMMGDAMMGGPDGMMGGPDGMMGDGMMGDGMMGEGMMGEGMMGDGMMGDGMMGDGMMGDGPDGMVGASPDPEAIAAPPSTAPGDQTPAPDASSVAGHEQHHPSSSPSPS